MSPHQPFQWPDVPDVPVHRLTDAAIDGIRTITPLFLLLHLVTPTTPGGLGFPLVALAAFCTWGLMPILGVCVIATSVLACIDRTLRDLPPACALGLLSALMLRDVFNALA